MRGKVLIACCLAAGIGAAPALAHVAPMARSDFRLTALEPPREGLNFALRDQSGRRVSLTDFAGKVVVLTFLYTHCPDVCPLVALRLREVHRLLAGKAAEVVFLAVTVDPKRDTIERLSDYSRKLDMPDQWHFLTGREEELRPVWDYYWVGRVWRDRRGAIMHQAPIHIIDQAGKVRVVSGSTFAPAELVHDVEALLRSWPSILKAALGPWSFRLDVSAVVLLFSLGYLIGWRRLKKRRSRSGETLELGLYLASQAALSIAILSPLDRLGASLFTAHMIQHELLMMVAAPLLLLSNPLPVFLWSLPRDLRLRLGGLLTRDALLRRCLRGVTRMTVALPLYLVLFWSWHYPPVFESALRSGLIHDLQHLSFFLIGVIFWWPIINPAPRVHGPIPFGFRIFYVVAAALPTMLPVMALALLAQRVLYPYYAAAPRPWGIAALQDQTHGWATMGLVEGAVYLSTILLLVWRVAEAEERAQAAPGPIRTS